MTDACLHRHYTLKNWTIGDSIMVKNFNYFNRNIWQKKKLKNRLAKGVYKLMRLKKAVLEGHIKLSNEDMLKFNILELNSGRAILNMIREDYGYDGAPIVNTETYRVTEPNKDYTYESPTQSFVDQRDSVNEHINKLGIPINGSDALYPPLINSAIERYDSNKFLNFDIIEAQKKGIGVQYKLPESSENSGFTGALYKSGGDGTTLSTIKGGSILRCPNLHLERLDGWEDEKGVIQVGLITDQKVKRLNMTPMGVNLGVEKMCEDKFGEGVVSEILRKSDSSRLSNGKDYQGVLEFTDEVENLCHKHGVVFRNDKGIEELDKWNEEIDREMNNTNENEPNRSIPRRTID